MTSEMAERADTAVASAVLSVEKLRTIFSTGDGEMVAVDDISFEIGRGEILGVVGESGCGKSVTAQSIMRLLDEDAGTRYEGSIRLGEIDLLGLDRRTMRRIRGRSISMIFQDPISSLNPVHTVGKQITETLRLHTDLRRDALHERAVELLALTGIPDEGRRFYEYPHELSGGMRQRVMIAMALACDPELLIADEPTTALDVTIQAQILQLLTELQARSAMSVMLITHDLGVIAEVCQRVIVMYLGQIVEVAEVNELFDAAMHPYTIALMDAMPEIDSDRSLPLREIGGSVPSLNDIPAGCRFASRCAWASERCRTEMPPLAPHGSGNSLARCWFADDIEARRRG